MVMTEWNVDTGSPLRPIEQPIAIRCVGAQTLLTVGKTKCPIAGPGTYDTTEYQRSFHLLPVPSCFAIPS